MSDEGFPVEQIDTSRPHPARMYDYYLGGWDNYEVDREAAEQVIELFPSIRPSARANRGFLQRATRFVTEQGIRQIIDIGTGIPTSPNTHETAQAVSPEVRVAYVDNDPIVAAHAGARLTGAGNTGFFLGDVREPETILDHPTIRELIDFDRPVALLLVAVLHFVTDKEDPARLARTLGDALPAGSYLVLSHGTADFFPDGSQTKAAKVYEGATATVNLRPHAEILPFFEGFDLLDPGLVQVPLWRPGPGSPLPDADELRRTGTFYGGVGYKA
ncbi:SAM-dependent methyltransferase [Streptomyces sp. NBC_01537]|uniref:SAM-dependent methyltransferase n=1 Tax=Streptomyces sp. NBC_01537 TaxID=2903896 RepID=UPI00386AC49E